MEHLFVFGVDFLLSMLTGQGLFQELVEPLPLVFYDLFAYIDIGLDRRAKSHALQLIHRLNGSSGSINLYLFDQYATARDIFLKLQSFGV